MITDGFCNIDMDKTTGPMAEAKSTCQSVNGYLPKLTSLKELDLVNEFRKSSFGALVDTWVTLTTDAQTASELQPCSSITECVIKGDGWKWPSENSDVLLHPVIEPNVGMIVNQNTSCMRF